MPTHDANKVVGGFFFCKFYKIKEEVAHVKEKYPRNYWKIIA